MLPGLYQPIPDPPEPFSATFITSTFSAANSTVYTFSSQSFGDPASNRYIIVGAGGTEAGNITCSIGGIAGSLSIASTTGGYGATAFFTARVPASTAGTVTVNFPSASQGLCGISIYRVTGINPTPTDVGTDVTLSSNALSTVLAVPSGGVGLAIAMYAGNGGARTFTWTNLSENFDATIEGSETFSGAMTTVAGSSTRTATASGTGFNGTLVVSAWGP